MIKVYSKEITFCGQCKTTKLAMDNAGLSYEVIDLESDAEAFRYVTEDLKLNAAPVVVISDSHPTMGGKSWAGFRPDLISQL